MKIKQLFTSFLACMALWSVPVYANIENDVYTKYTKFTEDKKDYGLANAYTAPTIDNPSVEQLKDKMDKKKDILDQAKEYQKSIKAFNEKYATYLTELKNLIDKADNENKRSKKRVARGNARNKMEALISGTRPAAFQNVVGITKAFVNSISSKLREKEIKEDVTKMKDRYNKEITKAKNTLITEENNLAGIIAGHQTAYDKALEAYNYKKTEVDLEKAREAAEKAAKEAAEKAAAEKAAAEKAAAEKAAAEKAAAEKEAAEKAAAEKAAAEKAAAETPTAETPTAETPTAETPTAETPTAETPTAETPKPTEQKQPNRRRGRGGRGGR